MLKQTEYVECIITFDTTFSFPNNFEKAFSASSKSSSSWLQKQKKVHKYLLCFQQIRFGLKTC